MKTGTEAGDTMNKAMLTGEKNATDQIITTVSRIGTSMIWEMQVRMYATITIM
jgi:hypothetical protein